MSTKKERLAAAIESHGRRLIKAFSLPASTDPVKLCKTLFRIENAGHHLSECLCNGVIDQESFDTELDNLKHKTTKALALPHLPGGIRINFNTDPRGYFLKINDRDMCAKNLDLPRDTGGYGLIAPDLRENH
jgi:hypothetical protein